MPLPAGAHRLGGERAARVHRAAADAYFAPILPLVLEFRRAGLSLRQIGQRLAGAGIRTRQGGLRWSAQQVRRVLARALRAAVPEAAVRQAERVAEPATGGVATPAPVGARPVAEAVTPPAPTAPRYDAPLSGCAVRQLTDRELERFRVAFGFWR